MTYILANNFTGLKLFEKQNAEMDSLAANLSQLLHVRLLQQQHSPTRCLLTAPAIQLWGGVELGGQGRQLLIVGRGVG